MSLTNYQAARVEMHRPRMWAGSQKASASPWGPTSTLD